MEGVLPRRLAVRTVFFEWVASRSRTPEKLQNEPRVYNVILQHGYEYAQLTTACWPDWLPTETLFCPQNVFPRSQSRDTKWPLFGLICLVTGKSRRYGMAPEQIPVFLFQKRSTENGQLRVAGLRLAWGSSSPARDRRAGPA